ncbi:MAG: DedA family protein [Planctomycetia bacterium]|nr:DedA family protein [Planctomycetia bacterium]
MLVARVADSIASRPGDPFAGGLSRGHAVARPPDEPAAGTLAGRVARVPKCPARLPLMRRSLRLLSILMLAALAVPLVPFLALGTRLDRMAAEWLDPPPSAPLVAAIETGLLAADLLLPVPSSMVATLGGARLGVAVGTACAWLGMTVGAAAGWWLGRRAGGRALDGLDPDERETLRRQERTAGPLLVVLTRPLPLVAEAAALAAGAAGMDGRSFLLAAASGNLPIAFSWSLIGAMGSRGDALEWAMIWSLVLPVASAWLVLGRRLRSPRPGL